MATPGPDLLLYYYPYSFYSQKAVMALHQKNLKFRTCLVDIHKGKQFTESFLSLNPKGEVPVLVDDFRHIPDSAQIMEYIEDNFRDGYPRLHPEEPDLIQRVEQLHQLIHSLKIEALTFGSAVFDDLGVDPKSPYDNPKSRSQMKEIVENRGSILLAEANKNDQFFETLKLKLRQVEADATYWHNRDHFEGLIIQFEKVMDECEAELSSHDDPKWWLGSPNISVADISFSILLYRLWQLGFERRMWERNRPSIKMYFSRIQRVDSFKKAISMSHEKRVLLDILSNPYFLGAVGTTAIIGGGFYLWHRGGRNIPTFGFLGLFGPGEKETSPQPVKGLPASSIGHGTAYVTSNN